MPAKSWLILLFWFQNTFAQSSFLGAGTDNLPFFSKSSGFPNSPLVHFSQHFGKQQGERKYQTIDIDWVSLFADYITPNGTNVTDACLLAGQRYINQLNQANGAALKMFDASAKVPPPGQLSNMILHHPGTFDSCLEVASPTLKGKHCLLTSFVKGAGVMQGAREAGDGDAGRGVRLNMHHPINTKFPTNWDLQGKREIRSEDPSPSDLNAILFQILGSGAWKLGRCIPSECTQEDAAQGLLNFLERMIEEEVIPFPLDLTPYDFVAANCHTADEEIDIEAQDWGMMGVIAFFAGLVLIGTVVDITLNILHLDDVFSESFIQKFQGFSLYSNTIKLFHCPEPGASGALDCINGIRFLSMSWVLLGHGYSNWIGGIFVNNPNYLYTFIMEHGEFAAVTNALPSVDSFFLIGATLLSYLTLKELDKNNGGSLKFWIMFVVHRYIRLTGLYAIVIGLTSTLVKFFATGIQSSQVLSQVEYCQTGWWANLLYVNNLHWINEDAMGCLGQGWYMANDMQFFLTSPFIIFALWSSRNQPWKRNIGLALLGILLVIFTAIPTVIGVVEDYPFSPMLMNGADPNSMGDYMYNFYVVPWCRFQPYLVGLGLGYLLYKTKDQSKLPLNPMAVAWIWTVAFLVGCLVIYGLVPYQKDMTLAASLPERAIYGGFHRLAWALALSWVILACIKGAGGPVNTILSWPAWVPLARMSFAIYLVHMTVMSIVNSYASYRVNASQVLIIYYLIFVMAICIAISYALIVLFEAPLVHLEKLLFYSLGLGKLPSVRRIKTE